ncbi:hypothetical protein [Halogeometricum sp. CBA1124]|uniref:hypothetical protein n=1 Tax=Halogeometricum sp. CBA1124 TaxID=2668071 RepID=UPI001E39F2EF|nr:hypothetical protein [Halogeometricum sp. CBA1124]
MAISRPSQSAQADHHSVRASLTVLVTRDADGDLQEGVRARLAAVDCVVAVDRADVSGLRPALNDLRARWTRTSASAVRPRRRASPTPSKPASA